MRTEWKEFPPFDFEGAKAHVGTLPDDIKRAYVEVFEAGKWRFAYGDGRAFAHRLLATVTLGLPFRIRGVDSVQSGGGNAPRASTESFPL